MWHFVVNLRSPPSPAPSTVHPSLTVGSHVTLPFSFIPDWSQELNGIQIYSLLAVAAHRQSSPDSCHRLLPFQAIPAAMQRVENFLLQPPQLPHLLKPRNAYPELLALQRKLSSTYTTDRRTIEGIQDEAEAYNMLSHFSMWISTPSDIGHSFVIEPVLRPLLLSSTHSGLIKIVDRRTIGWDSVDEMDSDVINSSWEFVSEADNLIETTLFIQLHGPAFLIGKVDRNSSALERRIFN